jgi:hypothetical protein
MEAIIVVMSVALLFGLAKIRLKWAVFVEADRRPAILNQKHTDWPFLLRRVPRSVSAWLGPVPKKLVGNAPLDRCVMGCLEISDACDADGATYPKPIPDPGFWWLGYPFFFTVQTKSRIHFHIGFRWDDVDEYYSLSATLKHYRA